MGERQVGGKYFSILAHCASEPGLNVLTTLFLGTSGGFDVQSINDWNLCHPSLHLDSFWNFLKAIISFRRGSVAHTQVSMHLKVILLKSRGSILLLPRSQFSPCHFMTYPDIIHTTKVLKM